LDLVILVPAWFLYTTYRKSSTPIFQTPNFRAGLISKSRSDRCDSPIYENFQIFSTSFLSPYHRLSKLHYGIHNVYMHFQFEGFRSQVKLKNMQKRKISKNTTPCDSKNGKRTTNTKTDYLKTKKFYFSIQQ